MRSALVFAGAMTAWIFAVGALARCVPGPMTPRADATDATWETVTVPANFDAGHGGQP